MTVGPKICLWPLGIFLLGLLNTVCGQNGLNVDVGGKRFTINIVKRNWYQANVACAAAGLSLAAIETAAEYTALKNFLINKERFGNEFWLSGTTLDAIDPSDFTWLSNGNKLSYTQWQAGKPDPAITEACIYTDAQFKWVSVACSGLDKKYYICSRPIVPNCGITGRCKRTASFY